MVIYQRGEISVNITKKSQIYRLEAINSQFFFINLLSQKKIADISAKRKCPPLPRLPAPLPRLTLCPDSLSPTNLLLELYSPLCLYMRPPRFHLLLYPGLSVYPSSPSPANLLPGFHSPFCPYIRPPFPFVNFNQTCVYIYIY